MIVFLRVLVAYRICSACKYCSHLKSWLAIHIVITNCLQFKLKTSWCPPTSSNIHTM